MFALFRTPSAEPPHEALFRTMSARLPEDAERSREAVRRAFLSRAPSALSPGRLRAADLALLFSLYDEEFFGGELGRAVGLAAAADPRLTFRVSERMTSAAGKLYARLPRRRGEPVRYEIALSGHLLDLNFREGEGREVNGLACRDRADALLRVFEHELVHLVERLVTGASSCRRDSFRRLAHRLFGHRDVTHRLDTPRSRAFDLLGIAVGGSVRFSHGGREFSGRVNRIGKRVTVLVPDEGGTLYNDRRRYRKFHVPLALLRAVEPVS